MLDRLTRTGCPNAARLVSPDAPEDDRCEKRLSSRIEPPFVAERREPIHKMGVTGSEVGTLIANAVHDAALLLADVEVVASCKLVGISRASRRRTASGSSTTRRRSAIPMHRYAVDAELACELATVFAGVKASFQFGPLLYRELWLAA